MLSESDDHAFFFSLQRKNTQLNLVQPDLHCQKRERTMSVAVNSPVPAEDQARLLDEVLNVVKIQGHQMRKCLDNGKLMDGLKHCSNMLAELRTSALTPKNYYELYMAIFDVLRHLTVYLTEAHHAGKHHLADLYELVQYAGNIVPRLYLMITVGSVYMGMPDAPVREVMRDMIEMARGVQHPTRGLFLRNYLSGMTRDHLPTGESSGPEGNVHESIHFILTNFTEMNKLWVRLQHQGHSRDREKREAERKELRILVGTNLVRLSQLEGVDLRMYQSLILPGILDQVVSCRDVIAQEYLMEVIIQVFPDEFHLRTLQPYLSAIAELHPKVNVKQIIIALIDRLAAYASREADTEPESAQKDEIPSKKDDAAIAEKKKKLQQQLQGTDEKESSDSQESQPVADKNNESHEQGDGQVIEEVNETAISENKDDNHQEPEKDQQDQVEDIQTEDQEEKEDKVNEKTHAGPAHGIPDDVELFAVFWAQIIELVKARPDLSIQDLTALLVSLTNLSLSCYPKRLDYVDQILIYTKDKMLELSDSPDLHSKTTQANLLNLLLVPIHQYPSILTLLSLTNYQPLLALQAYNTRRAVAHAVVASILKNQTVISTPEDVHGVLELCDILLRDQKDAPIGTTTAAPMYGHMRGRKMEVSVEQEDFEEEQGWMAKLVHLFISQDEDTQFLLLSTAKKQFSEGGNRIKYTFPPLVFSAIKLARRYKIQENHDEIWEKKTSTLFRFIHQVIATLYEKCEVADMCLRLFLLAGQSADESNFEDFAYEFFVQAFSIYEESISESRAQFQAITCIVGALQQIRVFSAENYDTLITKAALHSAKLLKKPDQCRAVYLCSHLWWIIESDIENDPDSEKPLYQNGKRALECLQKALKIADSCMDTVTNVELFVEILNRYVYYFEKGNDAVTAKYLNGLIDLINTNLGDMDNPDQHPPTSNSSSLVERDGPISKYVLRHFHATIQHLKQRKEASEADDWNGPPYGEVEISESLQ
ncbi:vacuolar protein sorting-associated protein 35 [Radiomyces spectabilis]|uniref:vacuolar protein sorting-associated protein 35 n=1 Tax=Radiomyces spectabilis TaxID=64574 RepID=UPI00221ECF55|nr:vacuolar protein sorting-associated protein 35 [Radiomyces spectabilis]KAI8377974.1 vacuolar protein sorting-associated protein 35 [Radiomyces spectabilis]